MQDSRPPPRYEGPRQDFVSSRLLTNALNFLVQLAYDIEFASQDTVPENIDAPGPSYQDEAAVRRNTSANAYFQREHAEHIRRNVVALRAQDDPYQGINDERFRILFSQVRIEILSAMNTLKAYAAGDAWGMRVLQAEIALGVLMENYEEASTAAARQAQLDRQAQEASLRAPGRGKRKDSAPF